MAFGHVAYSLSELDLRMVKAVPPGGNWKNIPPSIPSKRLEQIRKSGGRTTLYGRLEWDKPSYTITTYFNRPGNGCYIHPEKERVLTSLEAARLQSFPDSYIFQGSKTSRTKQIGNAVPPLLGFAIGQRISEEHPELSTTTDLFCGAGGLTLGFKWAGFKSIVANDFFPDAGKTFRSNNPETLFLEGDITNPEVKNAILSAITKLGGTDIVMGGPPCQGFSTAGQRMVDDPRNKLYKEFVEIVEQAKPKIFVMENVEGILSMNQGKTFEDIIKTFESLGYNVSGKKLHAVAFGVAQRRKRVIIIGSRIGSSEALFPDSQMDSSRVKTVFDAIGDIKSDPFGDLDTPVQLSPAQNKYQKFLRGLVHPSKLNIN